MQIYTNNNSTQPKNTYLGQKGYTLIKNELTIEQQKQIRNDLMIKPRVHGAPINNQQHTFPAYRESSNKLYVPHYYGVANFGPPKEYKISEGTNINLEFAGQLRDYQEPVVNKFIKHCEASLYGGGLLELYCAWGKTSGSLYILSQLKKKTLVIVHKEFLMNQWIERIQQFLPKARVGKIQGSIIDVENKDIVLCMLQSLISIEYEASLFEQFGFTIIDEVHHISSQSFSNSLFKVVTKYMLGLSATMDRKDGTTHVFKMFLGDVIYKAENKNDHPVEVRAVTYKVNDAEFNDTILDYRGKPQNSSMISKLCEYNRRTEFIIQTLCDFITVDNVDNKIINQHKLDMDDLVPNCQICKKKNNYLIRNTCCDSIKYCMPCMENIETQIKTTGKKGRPKCPNCKKCLKYQQNYIENPYVKPLEQTHTIVMAHNLNILHYMYKKIVCKNLASVGYYIGGMSELELKTSEKKQLILASFSMSQEGLDIPTLNAEFLITPKTDIVQSVGRILRAKHKFSHPIIYDFIDTHDVFQRQWLKRKTFYKKQNYKIIGINSTEFNTDMSKWKNIFESKTGGNNKVCVTKTNKKQVSLKSNSSTDKSITTDSDAEEDDDESSEEQKDKQNRGKCLLTFKK
jgi:superfamily II DNA or RNA helicase